MLRVAGCSSVHIHTYTFTREGESKSTPILSMQVLGFLPHLTPPCTISIGLTQGSGIDCHINEVPGSRSLNVHYLYWPNRGHRAREAATLLFNYGVSRSGLLNDTHLITPVCPSDRIQSIVRIHCSCVCVFNEK